MGTKWSFAILIEIFQQSSTSEKLSNQFESRADICKAASTLTYSFKLPNGNRNESGDATDSKRMKYVLGAKYIVLVYIFQLKRVTKQMQEMTDHQILDDLDRIRIPKFTLQMDFSDMMIEYLHLQHGPNLTQFLLRDM